MTITDLQTLFGIINGMVGNTILILPLQGLNVGYMGVILVTTILGIISGYTAYLVIKHLGKAMTINQTIQAHFAYDKKYSKSYNIFISATFWPQIFLYFKLLVLQVKSCFNFDDSWVLPLVIFIAVFVLTTFLKNYGLGQKFLAYGIIGIIGYIFFLTWAQFVTPTGEKRLPAFGRQYQNFSSILLGGFSVHDFIVQVMIHNPDRKNYTKIIFIAYSIGIIYNIYAGLGSFAIVNRTPNISQPQIIQDYYHPGQWPVHIIQFLYSIHLISTMPEYILVSKVRLYQAFGYQQQQKVDLKGVLYIFLTLFISFLIYVLKTKLSTILIISGSIMSLFYVIIIPIAIHLKCIYYDKSSGFIDSQQQLLNNSIILKNQNQCECDLRYRSRTTKYFQLGFIMVSIIVGTYITVYTLWDMFYGKIKHV